jgi:phage terminase large subunit-like protein
MNRREADEINNYVQDCWYKLYDYQKGVKDGTIIVSRYMREVVSWFRETEEYEIKPKKVDRVFRFLYLINIYVDGIGYTRVNLLPWQAFFIGMFFGIYRRGTKERRFTESFTFMGRGNGKSLFAILFSIFDFLGYNRVSPAGVIISTVENRRKTIEELHKVFMNSPELFPYVHFNNGAVMLNSYDSNIKTGDRPIIRLKDVGSIRVVPNDDKKLDGLILTLAFIDEIHLLKDEMVYRNAAKSAGKRQNSLVMLISTAGYSTEGFCVDLVNRAKRVALGEIKDDKFLPFLFCLDKEDDIEDIANRDLWYKCNPSLGVLKPLKKMEEYYNDGLYSPKAKADFITKDLNVFIDYNEYEVLSEEDFRKAFKPVDLEKWKGKDCYLGLDLSKSNDLSSLVCLFHDEETETWEYYPFYWVGNDSKLFNRKSGTNITEWCLKNKITVCPDKVIDYNMIADKIDELSKEFNIIGIGYDNYAYTLFKRIFELRNVNVGYEFEVKQWGDFMSGPLSQILMSILSGKTIFHNNPVMLWNWKNTRIRQDKNGNLKIWKNECKDSVDGAIAMNNAMTFFHYWNYNPKRPLY